MLYGKKEVMQMKAAILINFKWITSNTVDNPFKDVSVFALNGIRIGKLKIFNDDREFCEIKDDLIEEFEAENPDFLSKTVNNNIKRFSN